MKIFKILLVVLIALFFGTASWAEEDYDPQYNKKGHIGSSSKIWRQGWFNELKVPGELSSQYSYYPPPINLIENADLAIWSGGTNWAVSSVSCVPDKWYIHDRISSLGGTTRVDLSSVLSGGTQVHEPNRHSMFITSDGANGASPYLVYPNSGISTDPLWYEAYRNKLVQFGAWVYTDAHTGGNTKFIRPFIITGVSWFETNMAFGPYSSGGWQFLSAVTTVPAKGNALAFGFQVNNPGSKNAGLTAYACGPTFVSGVTVAQSDPKPQETIYFQNAVAFDSNGESFDKGSGTSSFDVESRTLGKVPADVSAVYVSIMGNAQDSVHTQFRPSTTYPSGITIFAKYPSSSISGTSNAVNAAVWVPTDSAGDFDLYSSSSVTDMYLYLHAVKMR